MVLNFIFAKNKNKKEGGKNMVASMTGYGRGEANGEGKSITIEIKSVNHRYLEMAVRLPRTYVMFEERIKSYLKNTLPGDVLMFISTLRKQEKSREI